MCEKIEVLGVQIDGCTAKEAMQKVIGYMETEPINTVEILAGASVVELVETGDLREKLQQMELLVVGDQTLLKLSGVSDRTLLKEAETNLFLKMFLRYMKKSVCFCWHQMRKNSKCSKNIYNDIIQDL